MVSCQVGTTARPPVGAWSGWRTNERAGASNRAESGRTSSFLRPMVRLPDQQAEEGVDSAWSRLPVRPLVRQADRRWYETG